MQSIGYSLFNRLERWSLSREVSQSLRSRSNHGESWIPHPDRESFCGSPGRVSSGTWAGTPKTLTQGPSSVPPPTRTGVTTPAGTYTNPWASN